MFTRLHIVVEGRTEEKFVNEILVPHLGGRNISADARMIQTGRTPSRRNKGGLGKPQDFDHLKDDILAWTRVESQPNVRFTTMVDLYAYPQNAPGYDEAKMLTDAYAKVALLEQRMAEVVNSQRFIPYIQLHEYETLLYADFQKWDIVFPQKASHIWALAREVKGDDNIELINDGERSAPSKRLIRVFPEYEGKKADYGYLLALHIGLDTLRGKCAHFNDWLTSLEALGHGN